MDRDTNDQSNLIDIPTPPPAPSSGSSEVAFNHPANAGGGTPSNIHHGLEVRRAAIAGDPVAAWQIGCAYAFGQGLRKDLHQGERWLRQAAEAGLPEAMRCLAGCLAQQAAYHHKPAPLVRECGIWTARAMAFGQVLEDDLMAELTHMFTPDQWDEIVIAADNWQPA